MTIINGIEMDDGVDEPDDRHPAALEWPPSDAKPGDVWVAYRLESDGWWRLAPPNAEVSRSHGECGEAQERKKP